jgi:trehalose 6-phosphate synthase
MAFAGAYLEHFWSNVRARLPLDPLDPGVLILSKFAGAAQQLTGALIVNPNDKLEVAEAIRDALQMNHQERITRWQSMIGPLRDRDVSWWAGAFLKELAAQESDLDDKDHRNSA